LLVDLGRLEMVRGNTKQSAEHFQAALELLTALRGARDPEVGATLIDLANVLLWENRLEDAERTIGRAREIFARAPELHPDRIMADSILAQILLSGRKAKEAADMFEKVLNAQRFVYGSDNALVADTLGNLANVRLSQNQFSSAEKLSREALEVYSRIDSGAAHKIGYLQTTLGIALLKQRKFDEAETVLRETLELYAATLPQDHQYVASTEYYYGEALLGSQRLTDAEAVLMASMNRWKRSDAPAWRSARSRNALGEAVVRQGRTKEGEQILVETFRALASDSGADKEAQSIARDRLERFYVSHGQRAKFDALLQEQNARVAGNR
jgi:tetratricopeptide (TPR) repeat protein